MEDTSLQFVTQMYGNFPASHRLLYTEILTCGSSLDTHGRWDYFRKRKGPLGLETSSKCTGLFVKCFLIIGLASKTFDIFIKSSSVVIDNVQLFNLSSYRNAVLFSAELDVIECHVQYAFWSLSRIALYFYYKHENGKEKLSTKN